jgi:magnesium transporter
MTGAPASEILRPAMSSLSLQVSDSVADARALLQRAGPAGPDLAVCLDGQLVGIVPVERLLSEEPDTQLSSLVEKAVVASPEDGEERIAALAARYGSRTVAVVDDDGRLVQLVAPQHLIEVLAREHDEDLARLGGFLADSRVARDAAEEKVTRRLWHRMPWLALGLVGAMASAGIVASFEEQLERNVLLAFFVPAVVYMADAVGTQTETVVIRAMALGISLRAIARRELASGAIIGYLLALCFFAFSGAVWGDWRLAAVVSLALLISTAVATVIAMTLPYGLQRLGRDPAFGSGPLATVIQDLLSVTAYFGVATALL